LIYVADRRKQRNANALHLKANLFPMRAMQVEGLVSVMDVEVRILSCALVFKGLSASGRESFFVATPFCQQIVS
jgi:hypothetical protein